MCSASDISARQCHEDTNVVLLVANGHPFPANTNHFYNMLVQHCSNVIKMFCVYWIHYDDTLLEHDGLF